MLYIIMTKNKVLAPIFNDMAEIYRYRKGRRVHQGRIVKR